MGVNRNYAIDTLRTITIYLVVLGHVTGDYINYAIDNKLFNASFWIANYGNSMMRICIPIFVIISGMFLLGRKTSFTEFYHKRALRIIIPTLTWSLIYILYRGIILYLFSGSVNFKVLFLDLVQGHPFYHMWYMFMLIGLYLFTPLINNSLDKIPRPNLWKLTIGLLLFGIGNTLYNLYLNNQVIFILWFINFLGYYFLGFLLKDYKTKLPNWLLLSIFVALTITLTLLRSYGIINLGTIYANVYFSPLIIASAICVVLLFLKINIPSNFLSEISHLTFGIYLSHALILAIINLILSAYFPIFYDYAIISIPLKTILVFILSYILCIILSRIRYLRKII